MVIVMMMMMMMVVLMMMMMMIMVVVLMMMMMMMMMMLMLVLVLVLVLLWFWLWHTWWHWEDNTYNALYLILLIVKWHHEDGDRHFDSLSVHLFVMSSTSKHESITQRSWLSFDPDVVASHFFNIISKCAHFMMFYDENKIIHSHIGLINTLSTLGVHETL